MPMSVDFESRLYPIIDAVADHFGTPFHIYDEVGIRATGQRLKAAFKSLEDFREYFAVKALPNPRIMGIMREMGFGFDCSSTAELALSRQVGAVPDEIMFTSNNTTRAEFEAAADDGGSILNLDDISLVAKVPRMPALICFRYNPGPRRQGNAIIGNPLESKYGVAHDQIFDAFKLARARGAERFGLHTMVVSNERDYQYMVETTRMLLELAEQIHVALGIGFEFINIGGGLGINYHPEEAPLDLEAIGRGGDRAFQNLRDAPGLGPQAIHGERALHDRPPRSAGGARHQPQRDLPYLRGPGCQYVRPDAAGYVRRLSPHHRAGAARCQRA